MIEAMAGLSSTTLAATANENWRRGALLIVLLTACAWWMPNVAELFRLERPALPAAVTAFPTGLTWRASPRWIIVAGLLLAAGVMTFHRNSPFLYFQF